MIEKILAFIKLLRRSGVKVSLVETLDCFRALQFVRWDVESFYATLRSTLIKDYEFISTFDKLFKLFFNPDFFIHHEEKDKFDKFTNNINGNKLGSCDNSNDLGCTKGTGGKNGQGHGNSTSPNLVETILLGSDSQLQELVSQGIASYGELKEEDLESRSEVVRKIKVKLDWKMGEYKLERLMEDYSESEKVRITERLAELEAILQSQLDQEFVRLFKDRGLQAIVKRTDLNELEFFQLSQNQVKEIKRKVTKLAHKLATRVSRREVKSKKGKIKLSNTLRKSMSTGGVPIYPSYKGKKVSRPQFVVLCDLSGSVRLFSEFMLQLVYSIQSRFVNVRSFAFVDTVQEITPYFQTKDITEGIRAIYYDGKFSKTGFSNYGQSFIFFNSHFPGLVTKKTTVIVLGDARNNYQPPCLDELNKIRENAHKLLWLNPVSKTSWNQEDSIMQLYQQHCSQVYECRNLNQLERTVKKIF